MAATGTLFRRKLRNGKRNKVWSGEWRDQTGKIKRKALSTHKDIARKMLDDEIQRVEREKAGMVDRYAVHHSRPLADHLADYIRVLEARRKSNEYAPRQRQKIEAIVAGCKMTRLADLDADRVAIWLDEQRRSRADFGPVTSNNYVIAIKGLSHWLWRSRRLPDHPLLGLEQLTVTDADRRHPRRSLTPTELSTLLAATREGGRTDRGRRWALSPQDRYIMYLFASCSSGLRAQELGQLRHADFEFDESGGALTVRSSIAKNRKLAEIPLQSEVAIILRRYLAGRPKGRRIWPGRWWEMGAEILRRDLAAAGLPYHVDDEGYYDFHALRGQYATTLDRDGVEPLRIQALMRHSDLTLTLRYIRRKNDVLAAAAMKVTLPPGAIPAEMIPQAATVSPKAASA